MKKAKKIFIGILSMVLLVGGTVNNTIAKEYVTGRSGKNTFTIEYNGYVTYRAGAFYDFNASMKSKELHRYQNMDMKMILYSNSSTNYIKKPSGTYCIELSSSLQVSSDVAGIAYLESHAKDSYYGEKRDSYNFTFK